MKCKYKDADSVATALTRTGIQRYSAIDDDLVERCRRILGDAMFPVNNNQLAVAITVYKQVYSTARRRQIVVAPSGSGKSHMMAALMVMISLSNGKTDFLVVYN